MIELWEILLPSLKLSPNLDQACLGLDFVVLDPRLNLHCCIYCIVHVQAFGASYIYDALD